MSTGATPLSTHAIHEVDSYIRERFKRPRWPRWMGRMPAGLEDVKVGSVPVGKIAKAVHGFTEGVRYDLAVWEWLRPATPPSRLDDLPRLRQMCGLDHVHPAEFASRLSSLASAVSRDHPRLQLWIAQRIALLDYVADPPSVVPPKEHRGSAMLLRNALLHLPSLLVADREAALELAAKTLRRAMDGAADAAKTAFGAEDCALSANLMVPLAEGHLPFAANDLAKVNSERAAALWGAEYATRKRLAIVAETHGSNHIGFWIPLAHGKGGSTLPGAARAFAARDGGVVFKDDLPPLVGYPEEWGTRWRKYMEVDFRERLFFSVPFRVPQVAGGTVAAAVLNVNVDAEDLRVWRRAYHGEWLCVARDRADPFIEVAYGALRVINSEQGVLALNTGSEEWDRLPPVNPQRQIKGAS